MFRWLARFFTGRKLGPSLKKLLGLMLAGVNTGMALVSAQAIARAHTLTRATILGTLELWSGGL